MDTKDSYDSNDRAITSLIDALRDAPLDGKPIDREISSDGTEIILINEEMTINETAERIKRVIEEGRKNGEARE